MATTPKARLTIEQLREESCFRDLTPKQQKMVETLIATNGDRVQAVMSAYNAKSPETARVMSYEAFANANVIACLAAYFQDDPLESFKREVQRAYRNRKLSVAQVQAMKLICDLNGWGSASLPNLRGRETEPALAPAPEEPKTPKESTAPKFYVGLLVTERDEQGVVHTGKVVSIDASGEPTIVEVES